MEGHAKVVQIFWAGRGRAEVSKFYELSWNSVFEKQSPFLPPPRNLKSTFKPCRQTSWNQPDDPF